MSDLTVTNLELLLNEYEQKIDQLDPIKYQRIDNLPECWQIKNRFFDIRWDNNFYCKNLFRICQCKCSHGKFYLPFKESIKGERLEFEQCGECGGAEYYNCTHTFCECADEAETDFMFECRPLDIVYNFRSGEPGKDLNPERAIKFNNHGWYDPFKDELYQSKIVVSLESIPILVRNLVRLDKELIRQNAFKQCMALIRSQGFSHMTIWQVRNQLGEMVSISVPRDIVRLIFYWCSF